MLRFLESVDKRIYELVDGTLVEKAMGMRESLLAAFIIQQLRNHIQSTDLGLVSGADGPYRMLHGNVRYPDVGYIPWESIEGDELPDEKIWSITPALAVEVMSESNTEAEIQRKMGELFARGCQLIWVIDPPTRTARAFTSPKKVKVVEPSGDLDGGKVLPGFRLPLASVFASLQRRKRKTR
ncbi:MAG: Uma2 family endonuclease [Gemmataceae bacterium]|nr:Uma2 family endonuclease [Planctomycetia bacterium]MBX3397922.1 Uma2 family endonuclease [Gemmataceae bacterium]